MVENLIEFGESFTPLPDYKTEPRKNRLQLRRFMIKAFLLEAFYAQIKPPPEQPIATNELKDYYRILELMNRITSTRWDHTQSHVRYHHGGQFTKCYTVPQLLTLIKADYIK